MTAASEESEERREKVAQKIASFMSKVEETDHSAKEALFKEVGALQELIDKARSDLGSTGAVEINAKHIPTATDELDAIVEATAMATGEIMDACDVIQENLNDQEGEHVDAIVAEVMKVYEACSFQDVTGQRIQKVVKLLHSIETKVNDILGVLSHSLPGIEYVESEDERQGDEKLLNGPQMPDKAISQDEIDALLDDLFD